MTDKCHYTIERKRPLQNGEKQIIYYCKLQAINNRRYEKCQSDGMKTENIFNGCDVLDRHLCSMPPIHHV